jgi:hypothetical protein
VTSIVTPVGVQLLEQAAIWRVWNRDGDLVDIALEDMTSADRVVVLAYLRRDPDRVLLQAMDDLALQQRGGEVTDRPFQTLALQLSAAVMHPGAWLEASPLVRRLVELTPRPRWHIRAVRRFCRPIR